MKKILIAGWRGISHSFAMVNQYQIVSLARNSDLMLSHFDMPYFVPHWNKLDLDAGFSPEEQRLIECLPPGDESEVDVVYRICSPMFAPNPSARKTLTFGVTELGYDKTDFANPNICLSDITAGENLVITPTRWSRDRLLDFGFDESKVRVVSHGVNLDTYTPLTPEELTQQRTQLGLSNDCMVFLNIGVPTWNKGIDLLIRAFATIHKQHKNIRLILKDSRSLYGRTVDSIMRQVSSSHPELVTPEMLACINVIPNNLKQAEMRLLYGLADFYVSPYRAEGFNLPVLEAQACGTPIITTSGGATDDFCNSDAIYKIPSTFKRSDLGDLKNCCWSEADFLSLTDIMLRATEDGPRKPHETDSLRQRARANAEKYSWDKVTERLITLM